MTKTTDISHGITISVFVCRVTGTLKVDDVKINGHAPMTATLGTAALFKFTGVCSTIEFTNFVMKD